MNIEVARSFCRQVLSGIHYIHNQGVCHLDISLENILVAEDNTVRLCDFGLASKGRHFPRSSQKRGKAGYIAPEIFAGLDYDGRKADVWSAGVAFFTMIVGCPPFRVPDYSDDLFAQIIKGTRGIKRILKSWGISHVPPLAVDLLSRMLCPSPKRWSGLAFVVVLYACVCVCVSQAPCLLLSQYS